MKQCSKCGEIKSFTEYYCRKDSRDGFEGRCKKCADRDKKDPEKRREITKRYYHAHKELSRQRCKDWREKNRERYLAQQRQWHKEHPAPHSTPEKNRIAQLKKYNLTPSDYEQMKSEQGGLCAICHEAKTLDVDHDHTTDRVRGLLCGNCNKAIGLINDSPLVLISATKYLVTNSARGINWSLFFETIFPDVMRFDNAS